GRGTAVFVSGHCFCPESGVKRLELLVGGERQPLMAHSMPRLDAFSALHPGVDPYELAASGSDPNSDEDPQLRSYRGGFWGFAMLTAGLAGTVELKLEAELFSGTKLTEAIGAINLVAPPVPLKVEWPDTGESRVAECMATYNPPPELLMRQLDSIR